MTVTSPSPVLNKDRLRCAEHMEKGRVVIEQVPVWNQPLSPGPDDVQMLWFVCVNYRTKDVGDSQTEGHNKHG